VTLSFVLKLRRQEIRTLKGSLSEELISSSQGTWRDMTCLLRAGQILMNSFTVILPIMINFKRHFRNGSTSKTSEWT
jgi:hypothetical protein